jgi:hypothetical protein
MNPIPNSRAKFQDQEDYFRVYYLNGQLHAFIK